MNSLTVELPDSLKQRIEELASLEGYTTSQFVASAAGEKLAVHLSMQFLREEAAMGNREAFDRYLAAVPEGEKGDD
ncbi:MAG: toxin-antitoxin system HicB family antitoxin [Verrucomicrobia bacterium]|nr:toxin-antitoxin system HicB family antitoxin [Verrucomicrobiota bacterium]